MFGFGKSKKNKVKKGFQHSQYWLPQEAFEYDLADSETSTTTTADALKLASIKRSIANFVRIVTNKALPVVFSSGKQSYTTGEAVVLSASTKEKKLDAVVGLALHEGTHCILSDFEALEILMTHFDEMIPQNIVKLAEKIGLYNYEIQMLFKTLWNIIEDRRIDHYMYKKARGYRPYYEAMYDHYFCNKQIDTALLLGLWREPTVENYVNTIINITNPYFDTRLLPDLDLIVGIMDLPHIERLNDDKYDYLKAVRANHSYGTSNTKFEYDKMPEIFKLICKISEIILKNSIKYAAEQQTDDNSDQGSSSQNDDGQKAPNMDMGDGMSISGNSGDDENDDNNSSDSGDDSSDNDDDSTLDGDEPRKNVKSADSPKKKPKVNENQLKKALDKQKNFIDGNVKKKKASKKLERAIKAVEDADATMKDVTYQPHRVYGQDASRKTAPVLVLKRLTRSIMESGAYPFVGVDSYSSTLYENDEARLAVEEGFRKGAILARKLQIRNQDQLTKFNRRNSGKIDKRRLAQLGIENEDVFYRLKQVEYKPVHLHLSIDNSSSMRGNKFQRALMVGVALAVAADKIDNLDVVLSMRAGVAHKQAVISILYDSKVDSPVKIRSLFPYLKTTGVTPEGLCFAAIQDILLQQNADEMYFINLSDGEPYFDDYGGQPAWEHTRKQINELRRVGIKILSYFIEAGAADSDWNYYGSKRRADGRHEGFDTMYGKDAVYIDVNEIAGLIRTLNKMFLNR